MKIDTVLFDLDGTLIDTNHLILESFKHTLQHFFPDEYEDIDLMPFVGEPLIESFKRFNSKRAKEMVEIYRKHNLEYHDLLIQEFDGVFETVQELDRLGIKLAVVTNKLRPSALKGLELTKLNQFFDVVITLDDVARAKPHAEPLEKAMALLQSEPETTLMVGDSQFDIEGGKRAGTYTAGVAWSLKGKEFIIAQKPDFIIGKMPELLDIVGEKAK
ncbi:pyrophosphatase PpaX [Pueribacillus theae]|uniref:Pyrophosphatase PpaX n=1 Tax=Pueribacillus theae TaxID=2171751 RepID=A0A2U1K5E9_9BACI|nr:pyrophosphatase PpaX [Pueribacillus theae]PWA12602.1 pyrophosphatase PpaX [Pueribacillus theae]